LHRSWHLEKVKHELIHIVQAISQHRQAYIAIQATSWATVFGPPSVLKQLVDSSRALRKSEVMMQPAAFGAIHAAHLTLPNLEYMIGQNPILEKKIKTNYRLMSGSKYRPMPCSNLRKLLQEILEEIFQHGTNPERLFEAGISLLGRDQEISLFALGYTPYLVNLKRTLQRKRFKVAVRANSSAQVNFDSYGRSESVAIIGMSGRFPGSDSIEELWTSIMERKEFHKKVTKYMDRQYSSVWMVDMH
jgi:Starter unit:ACP transacylase in aflatoxin biosynthesis/Beta-ketoacyl synthase, N-terminal domain